MAATEEEGRRKRAEWLERISRADDSDDDNADGDKLKVEQDVGSCQQASEPSGIDSPRGLCCRLGRDGEGSGCYIRWWRCFL